MPIKLLDDFPAKDVLEQESIFAIDDSRASQQDIRPLKVLILNLMPNKIDTEVQLLRLVSNTPLQIDVDFLRVRSHISKNTDMTHLYKFYLTMDDIKNEYYDAMIVTGAPLEHLDFHEVDYWNEMEEIMNWSQSNVFSVVHICWGAQAGLYHHYGVDRVLYEKKLSGVYPQRTKSKHFLLNGFDDVFYAPQSRHTGIDETKAKKHPELEIIASSEETGSNMIVSKDGKNIFVLGHLEYTWNTLDDEYKRDLKKGLNPELPYNYYPNDDCNKQPLMSWKAHANLFYHNWLNMVYQQTPYDLTKISTL